MRGYKYRDRAWLEKEYFEKRKSLSEIARSVNVCQKTIINNLDRFGLARRPATNVNHVKLSKEASEFLTGELLGDASIVWGNKPTSAYYTITSKHETYLRWIEAKLLPFGIARRGQLRPYKNKYGVYWLLQSKYYRDGLSSLRELWYPKGKKIVPEGITLTPLTVRMWFIEDGSAFTRSSGKKSVNFCTNGFEKGDTERLAEMLTSVLGVEGVRINKAHGKGYLIVINKKAAIKALFDYIGNCPTEIEGVFGYKWALV